MDTGRILTPEIGYKLVEKNIPTWSGDGVGWLPPDGNHTFMYDIAGYTLSKLGEWAGHEGPLPSAARVVELTRVETETGVVASIASPAWRKTWILAVIRIVVELINCSCRVHLHAALGGGILNEKGEYTGNRISQTDMEQDFMIGLLGSLPDVKVLLAGVRDSLGYTMWKFELPREGLEPCHIYLYIHPDPSKIRTDIMKIDMRATKIYRTAPNLKRVAVLSSPTKTLDGERVDEILNRKLEEAMKLAADDAAKEDW